MGEERHRNVLEVPRQEVGRPPEAVTRGQNRVGVRRSRSGLFLEAAL
jgi:hypothetical protein